MRNIIVMMAFWSLLTAANASAEVYTAKNCKVNFSTTGEPVLVRILGHSESGCEGKVTIEGGKVKDSLFKLELNKLDTGIGLRNKHLRENYLETAKFPNGTLKIIDLEDFDAQKQGQKKDPSKFTGELELHGTKKNTVGATYQIKGNKVTASFDMDLPDWGVKRPSFMGVNIVDKVHITVNFEI